MENRQGFHLMDIDDPKVIERINQLESQLSAELQQPVALIAWSSDGSEDQGHA